MTETPMVRIVDVNKSFGADAVLQGIDLTVDRGEVLCLLGPSGSGKSTLLRCINRLERPDSGFIEVDGDVMGYRLRSSNPLSRRTVPHLAEVSVRTLNRQRAAVGMVFQHFNLFPHMTAVQNVVESPIGVLRLNRAVARREALALLDRVGLADHADKYPRQLSGGQQQRVAIARALAMRPKAILFDEPTSALDPQLVGDVLAVMTDLAEEGMTMIVVTHEIQFAATVADRVAYMQDGRIVEIGAAAQVLNSPTDPRTAAFLSRTDALRDPNPTEVQ